MLKSDEDTAKGQKRKEYRLTFQSVTVMSPLTSSMKRSFDRANRLTRAHLYAARRDFLRYIKLASRNVETFIKYTIYFGGARKYE